ncbi:autotransporter outer membrane beta-barrel domain-containing protein [Bartonella sp. MM55XZML]|uniref:autotransporter outer membrane beta-barrel domain-containing protein n=1 Tax=Bartonella sp. MM55XZML TaxID=3243552 RepID=UPI0035CEE0F7
MIYVFHKYVFLCNVTTAILYFLQVTYVNAAGSSSDAGGAFYKCDDRKTHFLADKVYYLKSSQETSAHIAPIAAIYVEKAGTIVNASQITVFGDDPDKISAYGAYVRNGGKINLMASDFKNIPALRAQNAVISMAVGEIKGTSHAIYAWGRGTDIALVSVNINIEPDNLNVKGIGIMSGFDAMVKMTDGTVNFNQIGSFSTRFGGRYLLDTMGITGQGRREETLTDGDGAMGVLPEAFEVFQGGDVHLKNNFIQLNHMHAFLMKNFSGYVNDNGKLIQKYISPDGFKNTSIKIEKNNISVQGEGVYGLCFNVLAPEELTKMIRQRDDEKNLETKKVTTGRAFVYLSETNMTVPDGIAIYAKGNKDYEVKGTLELSDETKISGDLLLKAENNASLLVKANASSLTGGTRVEDRSVIDLELIRYSKWYLTKSKYNGLQESVSSLSSLSLSNSTLIFDEDSGYQTLRIGKKADIGAGDKILASKDKKVYSAEGNAQIRLNTFLNDEGLFDPQKTDRILIYGDVSGTTFIHMRNFPKYSSKEVYEGRDQSISIVQVAGTAQAGSFRLANGYDGYTTVKGFPYQYRIRGYGPGSPFGEANAKQRLVEGEGDFRLEGIYISSRIGSYNGPFGKPSSFSLSHPVNPPSSPPNSLSTSLISDSPSSTFSGPVDPPPPDPLSTSFMSDPPSFTSSDPVDPPPPNPLSTSFVSDPPSSTSSDPVDPPPPDPLSTSFVSDPPSSTSSDPVDPPPPDPLSTSFVSDPPSSTSSDPVDPPPPDPLSTSFVSDPPSSTSSDPVDPPPPDPLSTSFVSDPPSSTSSDPVDPPPPDPLSTSFVSDPPSSTSSDPVDPPPPDPLSTSFVSDPPSSTSSDPVDPPPPDPLSTSFVSDPPSSTSSDPVDPPPPDPLSTSFVSDPPSSTSSDPVDPPPPDPLSTSFVSDPPSSTSSDPVDPPPPDPLSTSFVSDPPSSTSSDPVDPPRPNPLSMSLPSEPSAPEDTSSPDSVPSPSAPVEPKPSESSEALEPSSNLPMSLDVPLELGIRAVVPQLPTYLLLPNTLFYVGLMDTTTQNKTLETMRNAFHSSWKEDENTAFFLRAYGGSHHYASNLSAFEYGYGAELDYNALEAGVLLNEIENLYTRIFFGALGNYGNLSLHPQDVEQSKKSAFNKWSVGAYGSLQHDTGFYMDGVLSYGLFKGDVLTLARGKVVALKGKQFSGSLTSGRTFATGYKGVVFDPQIQVVYQHLQFNQARDIDNLDVDLGKFHQWVGRVGGCLSKTFNVAEEGRVVSFYSKLSYLHSFEDKQFVSFKKDFQLGSFGSSLEAGVGFNARLSSKLSLHGDVTYQHRFKKIGFSGASFSAGLRHLF